MLGRIGDPVPLLKAIEQKKYDPSQTEQQTSADEEIILYTLDFHRKHFEESAALSEEDFATNSVRSRCLADRVIELPDEKFKNKKQVLFGVLRDAKNSVSRFITTHQKHMLTPNQITFRILAYVVYKHEIRSILRMLSRTAFIISFDESMF